MKVAQLEPFPMPSAPLDGVLATIHIQRVPKTISVMSYND